MSKKISLIGWSDEEKRCFEVPNENHVFEEFIAHVPEGISGKFMIGDKEIIAKDGDRIILYCNGTVKVNGEVQE